MDDMKVSFKVEITGCATAETLMHCPFLHGAWVNAYCAKDRHNGLKTIAENMHKLTKTCPMVRAQFEALE